MSRSFTFLFFLLFVAMLQVTAQAPAVVWQKIYGNSNGDYAHSIQPTADGGYIVAGYVENEGGDVVGYHGNPLIEDIWVIKINSTGTLQWQKCLGGVYMETGADIHQTPDGGYIVAGSSSSVNCDMPNSHNSLDYWVVKLSDKGDIQWQKNYGGSQNEYCYSIDLTSDGGYIMAGHSESNNGDVTVNYGYRDYWIVKIDGSGNLQWQKSVGGSGDDEAYSLRATSDGGCIVAGYTESVDGDVTGNHGKRDYWVVKLGSGGVLQWQKCLGGSAFDQAWSVQLTNDGGYIVAGFTGSNNTGDVTGNHDGLGPGDYDFWVVKLNSTGTLQWQKCYGGDFNEIAYSIQVTPDGGYVVCGSAESHSGDIPCNSGITDMWVIKISSTGGLQWQKSMGGGLFDEAYAMQALNDGTFILCGITCSVAIPGYHPQPPSYGTCGDFWVLKLSAPVASPPPPAVTIKPVTPVCSGSNATFRADILYGGSAPDIRWKINGNPVGNNAPEYTGTFNDNDILSCTVNSGGPCEVSPSLQAIASVTVKVSSTILQPQVAISSANIVMCDLCTPLTFKASVTNGGPSPVYQWKINGKNTGFTKDVLTTKLLQPGDVVNCIYFDTSACILNGSVTSNSLTITQGTAGSPSSITIATPNTTICAGTPVTFTATPVNGGPNPGYQWKVNGINAGTNSTVFTTSILTNGDVITCVIIPDATSACAGTTSATSAGITMAVNAKGTPSVVIATAGTTVCTGAKVTFTATTVNAGTNPSYQWKINGLNTGTNGSSFTTTGLNNGDQVSCVISVDPLYNCAIVPTANSNTIPVTVTAQPNPTVTVTVSGNDVCAGGTVTFTASSANAGAAPTYQWVVNNTPLNSNNTAVFSSSALSNGDVVYCLVLPGAGSCAIAPVASNSIAAVINALPVVTITPADTLIKTGDQVQLKVIVTGTVGSYQWSPVGKLENANTLNPITIHLTDNTLFTLEVESDKGCRAIGKANIKVGRPLFMPNVFSPNGDRKNDVFRIPPGVFLNLKEFSIFDRWGSLVFTTRDPGKGWDGTFHGQAANAGTYVYYIRGTDDKGTVSLKGQLVLVR